MGFFKRITATVAANVDSAIATMENHNAVVEASLQELRTAAARSKARLRRIQADGTRLETKLAQLRESAQRWTARGSLCRQRRGTGARMPAAQACGTRRTNGNRTRAGSSPDTHYQTHRIDRSYRRASSRTRTNPDSDAKPRARGRRDPNRG